MTGFGQRAASLALAAAAGASAAGSAHAQALPQLDATLSGLGLWVSARIADAHGGRLDIANAQDGGASVTLRLPAA